MELMTKVLKNYVNELQDQEDKLKALEMRSKCLCTEEELKVYTFKEHGVILEHGEDCHQYLLEFCDDFNNIYYDNETDLYLLLF